MLVHPGSFLLLLYTNFSPLKQGILPSSSASLLLLPCSRAQSKCPHTQLSFCEIFAHLPLPNKDKDACLLFGPRAASQLLVTYTLCADEGDAQCVPLHLKSYVSPHPPGCSFLFPSTALVTTHLEDWVHHMWGMCGKEHGEHSLQACHICATGPEMQTNHSSAKGWS